MVLTNYTSLIPIFFYNYIPFRLKSQVTPDNLDFWLLREKKYKKPRQYVKMVKVLQKTKSENLRIIFSNCDFNTFVALKTKEYEVAI